MPKTPLIYTDQFPYHVMARSNNKEWFYLPQEEVWGIFVELLFKIIKDLGCQIHAFVLMNNHYHMILSTNEQNNLGVVMQYLQKSVSRTINSKSGRINHVFGGPYKGCLVTKETYYAHALKYVYRNPVEAKICDRVEQYPFSSIYKNKDNLALTEKPKWGLDHLIPKDQNEFLDWLNQGYSKDSIQLISKAISKTKFRIPARKIKNLSQNDARGLKKCVRTF